LQFKQKRDKEQKEAAKIFFKNFRRPHCSHSPTLTGLVFPTIKKFISSKNDEAKRFLLWRY
jgi:hypothetical protein